MEYDKTVHQQLQTYKVHLYGINMCCMADQMGNKYFMKCAFYIVYPLHVTTI